MGEILYSTLAESYDKATTTDGQRLREIRAFRSIFEPEVAALAAANACERDVERLKSILADQEECIQAGKEIASSGIRFHLTLARTTKNSVLREIAALLYDMLAESRSLAVHMALQTPERMLVSLEGHRRILEAMEAKDPGLCREAMIRHLHEIEGELPGPG